MVQSRPPRDAGEGIVAVAQDNRSLQKLICLPLPRLILGIRLRSRVARAVRPPFQQVGGKGTQLGQGYIGGAMARDPDVRSPSLCFAVGVGGRHYGIAGRIAGLPEALPP